MASGSGLFELKQMEEVPPTIELVAAADVPVAEPSGRTLVDPFVHAPGQTACDFCGASRSQRYKFDLGSTACRELRVCASSKCDGLWTESKSKFFADEGRVPLEVVESALPGFLDTKRAWRVVRGSGDVEDGWKLARNWRVSPEMGALQRLRGEPWWRVPLQRDDKVKLALLDELRLHNPNAFADDVWDMLLKDLVPSAGEDPSDAFLENYPARVWRVPCPGDAKLLEMRL